MLDQLLRAADQAGGAVLQIRQAGAVVGTGGEIFGVGTAQRRVIRGREHPRHHRVKGCDLCRGGRIGPSAQCGERSLRRASIRCFGHLSHDVHCAALRSVVLNV